MAVRVPSLEAGLGPLPEHRRGGHVASGLAEDPVVEHDAGDLLTAGRGVQHLLEAFADHVAVALHREDDGLRAGLA